MKPLLIATNNPGKFKEISSILELLPLKLYSPKELKIGESGLIEDGNTYAENAYKKAAYFAQKTGMLALADDSGIIVEALKNELGVKTRRWGAGEKVSDEEWVNYFLKRMEKEENRKAKFVCHACLVDEKGKLIYETSGETEGMILRELQAPIHSGLPLSSCFLPKGFKKVYAAMTDEEKGKISHRGKAIAKMKEYLSKPF